MHAEFGPLIFHMERRNALAGGINGYWIVVGNYLRDLSNVSFNKPLEAAGCGYRDIELHDYSAVLSDSVRA
jgi:hypothetical protein